MDRYADLASRAAYALPLLKVICKLSSGVMWQLAVHFQKRIRGGLPGYQVSVPFWSLGSCVAAERLGVLRSALINTSPLY